MSLLAEYIEERYGTSLGEVQQVAEKYTEFTKKAATMTESSEVGFVTYVLKGDCCIILDAYIKPEYRRSGACKTLFEAVKTKAINAGKCAIITFSERAGHNQHFGQLTAKALGFKEHARTDDKIIFVRGTN